MEYDPSANILDEFMFFNISSVPLLQPLDIILKKFFSNTINIEEILLNEYAVLLNKEENEEKDQQLLLKNFIDYDYGSNIISCGLRGMGASTLIMNPYKIDTDVEAFFIIVDPRYILYIIFKIYLINSAGRGRNFYAIESFVFINGTCVVCFYYSQTLLLYLFSYYYSYIRLLVQKTAPRETRYWSVRLSDNTSTRSEKLVISDMP